jgi:SAM-dependent methyltransferase
MNRPNRIDPQLYQLHHAEEEDISFWLELARKLGDPILEIGCGTGRVLIRLARAGYQVVGLDNNLEMLRYLWIQLETQFRDRVIIFQADAEAFHLESKYPLIFLPCNTLSTMSKETREETYTRVFEHLTNAGIFAASVPNPRRLDNLPVYGESTLEQIYNHPKTGNPLQISSEWERSKQIMIFRWHYDHLFPDGRVERITIEDKHTIVSWEEYLDELLTAHLHPIKVYGDFDKAQYSEETPYLIFLTRRGFGELSSSEF